MMIVDGIDDVLIDDGSTSAIINPPFHQQSSFMYSSIVNQTHLAQNQVLIILSLRPRHYHSDNVALAGSVFRRLRRLFSLTGFFE